MDEVLDLRSGRAVRLSQFEIEAFWESGGPGRGCRVLDRDYRITFGATKYPTLAWWSPEGLCSATFSDGFLGGSGYKGLGEERSLEEIRPGGRVRQSKENRGRAVHEPRLGFDCCGSLGCIHLLERSDSFPVLVIAFLCSSYISIQTIMSY